MTVATIYFNDSASRFNKDLVDFLRRNLEKAVRQGRLSFSFKIAQTNELADLRKSGIKRLPAMIIGKTTRIGVPDIIEEIRSRVQNSKAPAVAKTEEEIVREYQIAALGNIQKDADGKLVVHEDQNENEDMNKEDLQHRLQKEMERRGLSQGGAGTAEPADPLNRMRPTPPPRPPDRNADRDDDFEDRRPPPVTMGYAQPLNRPPPRADNIDNVGMADAFAALNRVGRNATREDAADDALMRTLLEKIE
jgi:hypothetical protein